METWCPKDHNFVCGNFGAQVFRSKLPQEGKAHTPLRKVLEAWTDPHYRILWLCLKLAFNVQLMLNAALRWSLLVPMPNISSATRSLVLGFYGFLSCASRNPPGPPLHDSKHSPCLHLLLETLELATQMLQILAELEKKLLDCRRHLPLALSRLVSKNQLDSLKTKKPFDQQAAAIFVVQKHRANIHPTVTTPLQYYLEPGRDSG